MSSKASNPDSGLELLSMVTNDARVTLFLRRADVAPPSDHEVVVRIEAAPINPSDMGMLFASGDPQAGEATETDGLPAVSLPMSTKALGAFAGRIGKAMPVGNEGGGTVIGAGSSSEAQALLGKVVGFLSGSAYAQFRTLSVSQCLPMPAGTDPVDAAAAFVNPLTALSMVETMRSEGHSALVHTVGASNLGLMLNRVCAADGVGLVSIVRTSEQVELLRTEGGTHVCDSSAPSFIADLTDALRATGATIAFDAIGGGELAGTILWRMEAVAGEQTDGYSTYGSDAFKQVYIYGGLDRSPTVLRRNFGMSWSVGGWLLTPFLNKLGDEAVGGLRRRVANEITSTFASSYGMRLSLEQVVDPEMLRRYAQATTGDKALVTPQA